MEASLSIKRPLASPKWKVIARIGLLAGIVGVGFTVAQFFKQTEECALKEPERLKAALQVVGEEVTHEVNEALGINLIAPTYEVTVADGTLRIQASVAPPASTDKPDVTATARAYAPGGYLVSDSPQAQIIVSGLRHVLRGSIQTPINGLPMRVKILGVADGLPTRPSLTYRGDLGVVAHLPYWSMNRQTERKLTLQSGGWISNESLAVLRAYAMQREMTRTPPFDHAEVDLAAQNTREVGPDHRCVIITIEIEHFTDQQSRRLKLPTLNFRGILAEKDDGSR